MPLKKITTIIIFICVLTLSTPILNMRVNAEEPPRWDDTGYADFLYSLDLFMGTNKGFELERKFNRDEAAVMLVRLMGAEEEAISGQYSIPFDDVDDWARPYVGWLYDNGLTKGMSENKFGSKSHTTSHQYITFLVRSLGYSEADGDFTFNGVFDFLAEKSPFFGDYRATNTFRYYRPDFIRFDCTEITFYSLFWKMKDSDVTLMEYLIENGVFAEDELMEAPLPFETIYALNKDGKIVRTLGENAELTWLGMSEESYAGMGWSFKELLIVFAGPNQSEAYAVDPITLKRRAKLSDLDISMVFGGMRGGLLFYEEYEYGYWDESAENQTRLYKVYDVAKNEVTTLLSCQSVIDVGYIDEDMYTHYIHCGGQA